MELGAEFSLDLAERSGRSGRQHQRLTSLGVHRGSSSRPAAGDHNCLKKTQRTSLDKANLLQRNTLFREGEFKLKTRRSSDARHYGVVYKEKRGSGLTFTVSGHCNGDFQKAGD